MDLYFLAILLYDHRSEKEVYRVTFFVVGGFGGVGVEYLALQLGLSA